MIEDVRALRGRQILPQYAMKNILLEGRSGIGKTTVMQSLAAQLSQSYTLGGFLTTEIRQDGQRVGFRLETFAGDVVTLAHIDFPIGARVGKYRVDQTVFERIGVNGLQRALQESQILLIDEIGKMELLSGRFQQVVWQCLDSAIPTIATIMQKPHPFVERVKARKDIRLVQLTHDNREQTIVDVARTLQP